MKIPRISLEQWATFKAVVDEGSFVAAAEALNKSQSSISYAIARLNEQLPHPVLEVRGRRARLTADGEVLYRRATQLLEQACVTEQTAQLLAQNLEAEVTVAVDAIFHIRALLPVLEAFSEDFPLTRLRLLETTLSGTEEALLERRADLVIGARVPPGFMGSPLNEIRMVAVAAPTHPLLATSASAGESPARGIEEWELRQHRQVVLRDTGYRRTQDAGWLGSEQRWTVSHFSTSVSVLKAGLAFAFVPYELVEPDLATGDLCLLPLTRGAERRARLYLMSGPTEAQGPATRALSRLILTQFGAPSG